MRRRGDRLSFDVRVAPRASTNELGGVRDGALVVRVTAPPVEGAANKAVVSLLAHALGLPPSSVRIEHGGATRRKVVSVPSEAEARLRQVVK